MLKNHCAPVASDVNRKLAIEGSEPVGGGNSLYKIAHADGPGHIEIQFQTLDRAGLTNEALLAIVQDRLEGFQAGPCACEENHAAIQHIRIALQALHERTWRRATQGTEGKQAEVAAYPPKRPAHLIGRVVKEAYMVWVGDKCFDIDTDGHKIVEAVRALDPPLQPHEVPDDPNLPARLKAFKDTTAMPEDKKEEPTKARVEKGETRLRVGDKIFDIDSLKQWGKWAGVTDAALKLDPPITSAEVAVIEDAAAHLGGGARNGLTEFKSALSTTSKPRKAS